MISASHISYLLLCHRKLWLHHRQMRMEDNSSAVQEGKLIGESSYSRRPQKWRELTLDGAKVDHFDPVRKVVMEVKKSPKLEHVHIAQVKYYLFLMEQQGITHASGTIEYPKQKRTTTVTFTDEDRLLVRQWMKEIAAVAELDNCPPVIEKAYCKECAFFEFCYC
jgi:CRISPR-associated exonuclease Cas4